MSNLFGAIFILTVLVASFEIAQCGQSLRFKRQTIPQHVPQSPPGVKKSPPGDIFQQFGQSAKNVATDVDNFFKQVFPPKPSKPGTAKKGDPRNSVKMMEG